MAGAEPLETSSSKKPLAALNILVTRPAGQAGPLMAAIRAEGGQAFHYPVLTITELDPATDGQRRQQCKQLILDLDQFQHIIFISANAVAFGMAWIHQYWPQLPIGIHWYGIGRKTSQQLANHGVEVATLVDDGPATTELKSNAMNSEALLQHPLLQALSGQKVLIMRGVGGREFLSEQLSARGAAVSYAECYRRACVERPEAELRELLTEHDIDISCVNSAESLSNLLTLAGDRGLADLQSRVLLVPGERVATIARETGFQQLQVADNASDSAMLAALLDWAKSQ